MEQNKTNKHCIRKLLMTSHPLIFIVFVITLFAKHIYASSLIVYGY